MSNKLRPYQRLLMKEQELAPFLPPPFIERRTNKHWKAYLMHRAQAKYRGVPHQLTFPEWKNIWDQSGKWDERKFASLDAAVMTRRNPLDGWTVENTIITTMREVVKQKGHQ